MWIGGGLRFIQEASHAGIEVLPGPSCKGYHGQSQALEKYNFIYVI